MIICVYMLLLSCTKKLSNRNNRGANETWRGAMGNPAARLFGLWMMYFPFAPFFGDIPIAYKSENTQNGPTGPLLIPREPLEGNNSENNSSHRDEGSHNEV